MPPSLKEIRNFLEKARHYGYDAEFKNQKNKSRPGVDILQYPLRGNPVRRRWFWEDVWVGSNPFSGITTVWYHAKPCWQNHYWGYVTKGEKSEFVYSFLRWARREVWKSKAKNRVSILGKEKFKNLRYKRFEKTIAKDFTAFSRYEAIFRNRKIVCEVFETKGVVN